MLSVSEEKDKVLAVMKRVRFVTQLQLSQFLDCSLKTAHKHLNQLLELGQVEVLEGTRPAAYRLSTRVATALDVEYQRKWRSPAAIHQYLMKNEVELKMRDRWPSFRMLSAESVKEKGLNLAKAEWPARFRNEEGEAFYALVMIDDYLMSPDRLRDSLLRKHKTANNPVYLQAVKEGKVDRVPRWDQYASYCFVFTTYTERVSVFEKAISEMYDRTTKRVIVNKQVKLVNRPIPDHVVFEVHSIDAIWKVA